MLGSDREGIGMIGRRGFLFLLVFLAMIQSPNIIRLVPVGTCRPIGMMEQFGGTLYVCVGAAQQWR